MSFSFSFFVIFSLAVLYIHCVQDCHLSTFVPIPSYPPAPSLSSTLFLLLLPSSSPSLPISSPHSFLSFRTTSPSPLRCGLKMGKTKTASLRKAATYLEKREQAEKRRLLRLQMHHSNETDDQREQADKSVFLPFIFALIHFFVAFSHRFRFKPGS